MVKKIKGARISKEKMKELEGFEEAFDLIFEDKPKVWREDKLGETPNNMGHIEQESLRLKALGDFF